MNKKSRWLIAMILVLAMVLVACGGNGGEETPPPAEEAEGCRILSLQPLPYSMKQDGRSYERKARLGEISDATVELVSCFFRQLGCH